MECSVSFWCLKVTRFPIASSAWSFQSFHTWDMYDCQECDFFSFGMSPKNGPGTLHSAHTRAAPCISFSLRNLSSWSETICWPCSSSGDIKAWSVKLSRRGRMFSAPWCNAGPQAPAQQLCIYCFVTNSNVVKGIIFIWQMNTALMCTICRVVGWCANISHLFTLFRCREKWLYHLPCRLQPYK